MSREVVIVSAVRTPFSKFGGALRDWSTIDLSAFVFRHLLERVNLPAAVVDEIYLGLATVGEAALDNGIVARQALLKAGFPPETVSTTVDRACCSSFAAVQLGMRAIQLGEAEVVVAAGADNMGRQPFYIPADVRWGWRRGPLTAHDNLHELGYRSFNPVAVDTGHVALEFRHLARRAGRVGRSQPSAVRRGGGGGAVQGRDRPRAGRVEEGAEAVRRR